MAPRLTLPVLTRSLLGLLILFSLLNITVLRIRYELPDDKQAWGSVLAIVPAKSLRFPWTVFTAALVEENIFSFVASALTIIFAGRYLERAWGTTEFAKFLLFVTTIPNILTFAVYAIWYAIGGSATRAYTTINGAVALEAALLVAFKQLIPEHTVSLFNKLLRIRVKHFPALFVLANSLSGPLLGTDTAFFLSWLGFLTSWIYLRFYRAAPSLVTSETGDAAIIKGDASDTFAFSHFFPEPVQVVVAPLADSVYNTLVTMRVCTPFSNEAVEAGNEQATARQEGGLPSLMNRAGGGGGRREEAERRRALALKALDQRLSAAAAAAANRPAQVGEAAGGVASRPTGEQDG